MADSCFLAKEIEVEDVQLDPEGLPEVKRFGNILNAVNRAFNSRDIKALLNPFSRIGFT